MNLKKNDLVGIYLSKINNGNTRIIQEICSYLTKKISKRRPDGAFCENS